jgi:hypothetical protein
MQYKTTALMTLFLALLLVPATAFPGDFSGGGGSFYFGTGSPNSIDAASQLADYYNINDESGNYVMGVQGFYQAERYRLGGAFQGHAWAGVNPGSNGAGDDAAGVAAFVGGLYSTYTFRHDRLLLNAGAIVGAGRVYLGYSVADRIIEKTENVSTFYIEPQISLGVATCRWFAVEFQLSAPIFILTEDLRISAGGRVYTVKSGDMNGINFSIKLTGGKIANPY